MKFYNLIAGLLAWTVLVAAFIPLAKPLDVVDSVATFLGISDLSVIVDVDRWMQVRGEELALVCWLLGLYSLVWSYGWLWKQGVTLFDEVRGPATAWVCAAALAQVGLFPGGAAAAVLPFLAVLALVGVVGVVRLVRRRESADAQQHWSAIGGLAGGIALVVFWPPLIAVNAFGGRSAANNQSPPGSG